MYQEVCCALFYLFSFCLLAVLFFNDLFVFFSMFYFLDFTEKSSVISVASALDTKL